MNFLVTFLYYVKKKVKYFYNSNLGIHRVIIYFTCYFFDCCSKRYHTNKNIARSFFMVTNFEIWVYKGMKIYFLLVT